MSIELGSRGDAVDGVLVPSEVNQGMAELEMQITQQRGEIDTLRAQLEVSAKEKAELAEERDRLQSLLNAAQQMAAYYEKLTQLSPQAS